MAELRPAATLVAGACSVALLVGSVVGGDAPSAPTDLHGYRVLYRIEDRSQRGSVEVRAESLEVRRPFDSRVEVADANAFVSGRVTNRDFQWQLGEGAEFRFGLRRIPGTPSRDLSYPALLDAARAKNAELAGSGAWLGHRCTWFALKDPLPDPPSSPTSRSRVEACVTAGGVLLRQIWTLDGRTVLVMEATAVTLRAPPTSRFLEGLDPDEVDVTQPEAAQQAQSQLVVGDDVDLPDPQIEIDPPSGWKVARRSGVVRSAPASGRATRTSSIAFRRGNNVVVVERSVDEDDEPPWAAGEGAPIAVPVGTGRLIYAADHVEVRITAAGFARIEAPSRAVAVAFARRAS